MPKAPITFREGYFTEVRGSGNPLLLKRLEFNRVETELGTMAESVSIQLGFSQNTDKMANVDLTDAGLNTIRIIQEQEFQNNFNTGGNGWLQDANI